MNISPPNDAGIDSFAERHKLSPRETEVLRLGAAGLSKPATAQTLGCSYHTVVTHWRRMAVKLDVSNRQQVLIALAREVRGSPRPEPVALRSA